MALLKYEHFDLYGAGSSALLANGYTLEGEVPYLGFSPGRTGLYGIEMSAPSEFDPFFTGPQFLVYEVPGDGRSTLGVGVAMKAYNSANDPNGAGVYVNLSGGVSLQILPGANGQICIYQDEGFFGPELLEESEPGLFTTEEWFYVEVKLVAGVAGGASVEVRLNGSTTAAIPATMTQDFENVTQVRLGYQATAGDRVQFDDLVVWDTTGSANNNWMGNRAVVIAAPVADGAVNGFAASSGSNLFAMVDEVSPNDNDYITAVGPGDSEELVHTDPTLPANSVAAVAAQVRAQKDGSAAATIQVGVDSSGTDSVGAAIALDDGTWKSYSYILDLDPNGNVSWTNARAIGSKTRVESATTSPTAAEVSQQFKVLVVGFGAPAPGSGITFDNVTVSGFSITL